jgi:hypothetical protein
MTAMRRAGATNAQQRIHDDHQIRVARELAKPSFEISGGDLAEIVTKTAEESSNLVFQVEEPCPEQLTRGEDCPSY